MLAAVVAVSTYLIPYFRTFEMFSWISLIFFFTVTVITFYIGYMSLEKKPHGFVASVNGMVLIKLLLSVILVITYLLLAKPADASFIIPFFFFYIAFTVFEVRQLLQVQRLKQQEKT